MYLFEDIVERLKEAKGFKTDKQLYDYMGVGQGTFSNWKTRNSTPFEMIISICDKEKYNLKYILTGKKEQNFINFEEENTKIFNELNKKNPEKLYYLLKKETI